MISAMPALSSAASRVRPSVQMIWRPTMSLSSGFTEGSVKTSLPSTTPITSLPPRYSTTCGFTPLPGTDDSASMCALSASVGRPSAPFEAGMCAVT